MRQSPAFSPIRELMDIWDNFCLYEENPENKIKMLMDGQNLIMFFVKDKIAYGCPEESRLTFARIKHPNEDDADLDQARFSAINLFDALMGKTTENLFSKKDMKSIKIINEKKCAALLAKQIKKNGSKTANIQDLESQKNDRRPLKQED